ncbi:flagellar protein FlaG [Natranaerofaba carboxydovora]|uniref:flagellar protein FlaG n=1 Tax=Natranaerofaba carboxydovora TaxID=2742683 RepID=UPI001F13B685|nr:flagellar protein FlaG [Natranaerofaba carboxydovora]UMZ74982.1 FlaG protein [Natranaerofaba carboxydovora]
MLNNISSNNLIASKDLGSTKIFDDTNKADTNKSDIKTENPSNSQQTKIAHDVQDIIDTEEIISELQSNKFINKGFAYEIHEGTNRIRVEIINRSNNEVIKEIPPEKLLDIFAGIKENIGAFVDKKL